MNRCPSGKVMYESYSQAEDALVDAWSKNEYTAGNGPIDAYLCEEGHHYHLTSKGKMNERLARLLNDGTITRRREANRWNEKFNRR